MNTKILIQGYPISRYTLSIGAIALLYLTVAYLTIVIIDLPIIPPIYPVAGIVLGLLSAYGIRFWPGVALGSWICALVLGASSTRSEVFMVSIEMAATILAASLTELQLTNQVLRHNQDRLSEEMTRKEMAIAQLQATVEQQKQQLQEYQEALNHSNQLKNCLFQAIAHDLRTTLMGMVMFYQNLLKKPGETLSVRRSLLEKLRDGGDRQLQKLNTLLEVATLDDNPMAIASQPVNLALVLEEVLEDFQAYFADNGVHLNYHQPEQLPLVDADPQYIRRVFEHLLSNAVKHNPPGVEIQIQFPIDLSNGVSCWVIDNGVGIAPDKLPYLFSLDPQASNGQTGSPLTGISLGLYQCDRILAAHGGRLTVESYPTQGSRFGFNLPERRSD